MYKCPRCKQNKLKYIPEHESFYCNNCGARYNLVDDVVEMMGLKDESEW